MALTQRPRVIADQFIEHDPLAYDATYCCVEALTVRHVAIVKAKMPAHRRKPKGETAQH
jgi:hypothetical protein